MNTLNESMLFDFLKSTHINDLTPCEDEFSKYDCYSKIHNLDIELKSRYKHYDRLVIEKIKYDSLIERSIRYSTRPLYINSTPKGVFVFDLSKIRLFDWHNHLMPKTTEFDDNEKVLKPVSYIDVSRSTKIL